MLGRLKAFARALGNFQARVILTLFYITVVIPFALIARSTKPLRASGWTLRRPADPDLARARLQF